MRTGDVWYARWDKAALHLIPCQVDITISSEKGTLKIVEKGICTDYDEERATEILSPKQVCFQADMHAGQETASAWGCDLTYEYIKINAEYRK